MTSHLDGPLLKTEWDPTMLTMYYTTPTDFEQGLITSWYWITLILCLLGNTFVLYGTNEHNAISLDTTSIWIIKNLCVVDIGHGIFNIFPEAVVNTDGNTRWVFGKFLCYVSFYTKFYFLTSNTVLVNALAFNKLQKCIWPFRSAFDECSTSTKAGITVSAVSVSTVILIYQVTKAIIYEDHPQPQAMWSSCFTFDNKTIPGVIVQVDLAFNTLDTIIPMFALMVSNIALIGYAVHKVRAFPPVPGSRMVMTIVTVVVVTFLYVICLLPMFVWFICLKYTTVQYTRFAVLMLNIQCFVNPFVYVFTNTRFRKFVTKLVKCQRGRGDGMQDVLIRN